MPEIVHSDSIVRVEPGTSPDYDTDNPLLRLHDRRRRLGRLRDPSPLL